MGRSTNRVRRAVKQQHLAGLPDDYWSLSLPRETRHYVPRLVALSTLIAFEDALEIEWPDVPNEPGFVPVETAGQIEMLRAAEGDKLKRRHPRGSYMGIMGRPSLLSSLPKPMARASKPWCDGLGTKEL